jgi:phosphatidylserine/phosphatidylglycerophosphate/cardiolipin synthase-like enzyme
MENLENLETIISRIVNECRVTAVEKIIEIIKTPLVTKQTTKYEWSRLLTPHIIPAPLLSDFIDLWINSSLTSEGLLFGLNTAIKVKNRLIANDQTIELVWTGPYPPSSGHVRSTLSVMQEMLVNAKKQVLLVGYSLTTATPFSEAIIHQLKQAMIRGCEIKIALHDDGYNYANLKKAWPHSLPLPILLKWVGMPGDNMASLHAKMLLIDQNDLFVTSANLTYHGLNSNIEVGIRVRGNNVSKQMAYHFTSLERSGVLRRIRGNNS